jgi:hypothetical protein
MLTRLVAAAAVISATVLARAVEERADAVVYAGAPSKLTIIILMRYMTRICLLVIGHKLNQVSILLVRRR